MDDITHYVFTTNIFDYTDTSESQRKWKLEFQGTEGKCYEYIEKQLPDFISNKGTPYIKIVRDL